MEKISTIIADGNEIFRQGLRSILSDYHFDIVSEIDNGALVLSAYEIMKPQLCVLSFRLPEISGIHLTKKLIEKFPKTRILILADDSKAFHRLSDHYLCTERFLSCFMAALLHPKRRVTRKECTGF